MSSEAAPAGREPPRYLLSMFRLRFSRLPTTLASSLYDLMKSASVKSRSFPNGAARSR
jgi:hypothetical protein